MYYVQFQKKMKTISKQVNNDKMLYLLSFLPLAIQGMTHILIGNIYPLGIGLLLIGFLIYLSKTNPSKAIKIWSILLIGFGTVRVALHLLMYIDAGGVPSAIYYQFNFWYGLKSMLYIILGIFLYRKRKDISILLKWSCLVKRSWNLLTLGINQFLNYFKSYL